MLRRLKASFAPGPQMGPLEFKLLRALWKRGSATVRELLDEAPVGLAYTTVMTTLDRLYRKGILDRTPDGRAYRYSPKQSEEEFNGTIVAGEVQRWIGSAAQPAGPLSFLVDVVTERDAALLEELQRAVDRKRRELRRTEKRRCT